MKKILLCKLKAIPLMSSRLIFITKKAATGDKSNSKNFKNWDLSKKQKYQINNKV